MGAGTSWVRRIAAYQAVVRAWPDGAVLACSGGVDSSALLMLAGVAVSRGDLNRFPVVYVDHLTRPESASDGNAVEALAMRFGLPSIRTIVRSSDVDDGTSSPEDRLRQLRYAALARVAHEHNTRAIVTAHTRDDQVETVLMRLLSGSGGLALAGMLPVSFLSTAAGDIEVHRPLLDISRSELVEVLERAGVEPRIDATNRDPAYRRNRLRHEVVPVLSDVYPGFDNALLRAGKIASRDAAALDRLATATAEECVTQRDGSVCIDRAKLRLLDPAIASRVIRLAAASLMPENHRELTFERIESVRAAVTGRAGAVIELPYGINARIERAEVVLERRNQ